MRERYASAWSACTGSARMECGHCHLRERAASSRKSSRSNADRPRTGAKRVGDRMRVPLSGQRSDSTVRPIWTASSSSSPPAWAKLGLVGPHKPPMLCLPGSNKDHKPLTLSPDP